MRNANNGSIRFKRTSCTIREFVICYRVLVVEFLLFEEIENCSV